VGLCCEQTLLKLALTKPRLTAPGTSNSATTGINAGPISGQTTIAGNNTSTTSASSGKLDVTPLVATMALTMLASLAQEGSYSFRERTFVEWFLKSLLGQNVFVLNASRLSEDVLSFAFLTLLECNT